MCEINTLFSENPKNRVEVGRRREPPAGQRPFTGSIPGVWLGSLVATRIPEGALCPAVATLLFVTGVKLV
jgi:hypothetical protein